MELDTLIAAYRACRICRDAPRHGLPLPHEPRPIIQASPRARLCLAGQAPGTRVHASGIPFTDPSGVRLRGWLGMDEATFHDPDKLAIVPMGGCYPGLDAKGGDLPPRRECAPAWRARLMAALPNVEMILLVGQYAMRWHLGPDWNGSLTRTVEDWRQVHGADRHPRLLPLPHPSWRNNAWLSRNPWFEAEVLPLLRAEVARLTR
jgi:uracil-DNA glycosylase